MNTNNKAERDRRIAFKNELLAKDPKCPGCGIELTATSKRFNTAFLVEDRIACFDCISKVRSQISRVRYQRLCDSGGKTRNELREELFREQTHCCRCQMELVPEKGKYNSANRRGRLLSCWACRFTVANLCLNRNVKIKQATYSEAEIEEIKRRFAAEQEKLRRNGRELRQILAGRPLRSWNRRIPVAS